MTARQEANAKGAARHGLLAAGCALCLWCAAVQAQTAPSECGELANSFGPFDYRTVRGHELNLVEGAHFTASIEALYESRWGKGPSGSDIDYTLRAFPNHHRALVTTMRFGEREKRAKPSNMRYTVECWFERAVRFRPDDNIVRMLFAEFLNKAGRTKEAAAHLDVAARGAADNPFTHYNVGLMYFEIKEFDKSREQAHLALSMGFTRTELKDKLTAIGKWTEPPPSPQALPAAPAASGPAASQ